MLGLLRRLWRVFRRQPAPPVSVNGTRTGAEVPRAGRAAASTLLARGRAWLVGLAAATGAALFATLGWLVGAGEGALTAADLAVSTGLQAVEHSLLLATMGLVSSLGTWPWNLLAVLSVMGAFQLAGYPLESLFVGGTALGGSFLATGLKGIWSRTRPDDELVRVIGSPVGPSFPSGHTVFYVGVFGFLFYWCYTFLKPSRVRTLLLWIFALLVLLIGPSRVYLGHHWASDVLAGYAVGLVYLLAVIWLYRTLRTRPVAVRAG